MRSGLPINAEPASHAIREIAMQTHRSEVEVGRVFKEQVAALEADAKVKNYLTIFAKRRTRALLRPR
jgi:hypothetical protein